MSFYGKIWSNRNLQMEYIPVKFVFSWELIMFTGLKPEIKFYSLMLWFCFGGKGGMAGVRDEIIDEWLNSRVFFAGGGLVVKRLAAKFRSKFLSISNLKRGLQLPGITCSALTFVHRRQVGVTRSARRLAFAMSNVFEWNWAKPLLGQKLPLRGFEKHHFCQNTDIV